jgi:hypothetical protein
MSNLYDDATIEAAAARIDSTREAWFESNSQESLDDWYARAVLDAVAPLIAARALRDAADRIRKATHERLQRYEGAPRETASLAIDGTVNLLERLADEAKRGE